MSSDFPPPPARPTADLSNWRTPPFNRWAFQHVREFLSTADIANAPGNAWELPSDRRSLDAFRVAAQDGSILDLGQFLRRTQTDGLVVLLDGRIAYDYYAHGMMARTPHILMSASKSIVGLLAGILSARGDLDVAAPVSKYVPEVRNTAYGDATIRHLLDMRTGVDFDERNTLSYLAATGWEPVPASLAGHGLHSFFAGMTASSQPHGGPFRYVSANTDLLAWAIERAAGHPFVELMSELLWKPLGAQDAAYVTVDRNGAPRGTGGIGATILDFARLGQLLVQGGQRDLLRIIPEAWIDDISTGGDRDAWTAGDFGNGFAGLTMRYRNNWYVVDTDPKTIFAMGIHGQHLFVDRTQRLVVAKLSSQESPIDLTAIALTIAAVAEIGRCLGSRTCPTFV
jgi:CubicO group peptidase (beta-lactamase class C family)